MGISASRPDCAGREASGSGYGGGIPPVPPPRPGLGHWGRVTAVPGACPTPRCPARLRSDTEHVIEKRPQADRIRLAEIYGEAGHHAKWRELTEDEEAAAVAELRELAGGRADLLAEVAGILEGATRGGAERTTQPPGRRAMPCGGCRP